MLKVGQVILFHFETNFRQQVRVARTLEVQVEKKFSLKKNFMKNKFNFASHSRISYTVKAA